MLKMGRYEWMVKMKTVATLARRVELSIVSQEEGEPEKQFAAFEAYCEKLFREWKAELEK